MNQQTKSRRLLSGLSSHISAQNIAILGVIAVLVIVMQSIFPFFLSPYNIETIAMGFVFEGILALGMTFVIITGGIDLSVCSVMPFAEIICAKLMTQAGVPIWLSIIITLMACVAIGALNGFLTQLLQIHPMIITMASMLILRGVNLSITNGKSVSDFAESYLFIGQGKLLGINIPIWTFILLAIILSTLLNNHRYFRQIYFIGNNEKAASLSGIDVTKSKISFYALCSLMAGIAGVLAGARYGAAAWSHGNTVEVKAISAVAIGGASMAGGHGKVGSTVIGVLFLAVVYNAFVMSGINTFWFSVVNGAMLIFAILFSWYVNYRNEKRILRLKDEKLLVVVSK